MNLERIREALAAAAKRCGRHFRSARRTEQAGEYLRMAKASLEQTGEHLLWQITKMKFVDWSDSRDNLHNVRKDLQSWMENTSRQLEETDPMSPEDAKATWEYVEATLDKFGRLAFTATMQRLENRGYFEGREQPETEQAES